MVLRTGEWVHKTDQMDWLDSYNEIIRQYNAGEITQADAENNIRLMKESGTGWKTLPIPSPPWLEKPNRGIFDYITGERIKKAMAPGKEPNPEDPPYRERPPGGPPWPGYPKPMPPGGPPTKLAHAIPGEHGHPGGMGFDNEQVPQRQDLIINPSDSTEGVKFPMPIRGGGEGREQPMMTPQFGPNDPHPGELAQVDYTSPNPKFDQHMKNTPPLTKPKERIDHLKEGVKIRKA